MSDRIVAIPVIIAAALAVFLLFLFRNGLPVAVQNILPGGQTVQRAQPVVAVAEVEPPSKTKPRRGIRQVAATSPQPELPQAPLNLSIYRALLQMPLPRESDVTPGMSRTQLTSKFGDPGLRATWYDGGTLNEKWIYRWDQTMTVVILRDGAVVSRHAEP